MTGYGNLFRVRAGMPGRMDSAAYVDPAQHRPFRTPLVPLAPIVGVLSVLYLMASLPMGHVDVRFASGMVIGLADPLSERSRLR